MGSICLINGYENAVSETFIQAHVERLAGPVVVLNRYYPEYTHRGRLVSCFHHRRPLVAKLKKLLPHFLYHRLVIRNERSPDAIRDFIAAFMRDHSVDVILAEYGMNGADIAPHAVELGIPLIVHFHGHDAHREPDIEPYREKYRAMFASAFRIVSVSRFMTRKLEAMGCPPEKIVYNPYGPREHFYENAPAYAPVLLAVGRFADIKAPYLTLMAFREALRDVPHARLVMVGDGPLRETCLSLAKLWGMEASVSFPGALRHEATRGFYAEACAFVQHSVTTSYGDAEGTPVAILEAQAAALPVISTRHAGIVDAVVDGVTGLLCDERDVAAMAGSMVSLLCDPERCRRMGAAARAHIRENFPLERHIGTLQRLVDQAREEVGAPRPTTVSVDRP